MKVYNTLTRKKEEFEPIEKGKVKMYICGPTVYDLIHIGNARPAVVFDSVRRYFLYKGFDVTYVQNFTDVDDKIINKAKTENVTMDAVSDKYIKEAFFDSDNLNIKRATFHPRVTSEMPAIIDMIQTLIQKGSAYEKNGSVYFDTKAFADYGKLSRKNIDDLLAGASDRVTTDEDKKSFTDFVLWKPFKDGEPFWDSPWGKGRPGWHIECSVMAKKYLGDTFDIHAGGEDLIFPHHENEIAQSEACNDVAFANYWMHNGFITINNEKMAKSTGNFFTVRDIAKDFPYEVIRFFILNGHYRSPINFSRELLTSCESGLGRIKNCYDSLTHFIDNNNFDGCSIENLEKLSSYKLDFEKSMEDDFNTADAISVIYELVRFINIEIKLAITKDYATKMKDLLVMLSDILGISYDEKAPDQDTDIIEDLIKKRSDAKKDKDFKKADEIRDQLLSMGIVIKDTRTGVQWSRG